MSNDDEYFVRELKEGIKEGAKQLGQIAKKLALPSLTKEEEARLLKLQAQCRAGIDRLQKEIKRLQS